LELLMEREVAVRNSQLTRGATGVGVCAGSMTIKNYLQLAAGDSSAAKLHACALK
jgi:hypothetical protein